MNWYLLQTKPNAHVKACENLRQQGFDVFLPLITKTTKKNGKFLNAKVPLFPGYLFMGTSIDPIPWTSIKGTKGISNTVSAGGVYRPISPGIIEGLQLRCNENGVILQLDEIALGDRVKIEKGPFADFISTIEQITDGQRAWVLIDLLQQKTRVEVSLNELSKIH